MAASTQPPLFFFLPWRNGRSGEGTREAFSYIFPARVPLLASTEFCSLSTSSGWLPRPSSDPGARHGRPPHGFRSPLLSTTRRSVGP